MKEEVLLWYKKFMISSILLVWKFILCEKQNSWSCYIILLFSCSATVLL